MSLTKSKIVSAVRGAFIADAASMGTHWIYNPTEMAKAVPSIEEPEFKTPPNPSYYGSEEFPGHYGPGMLSPYGEQMLFVIEHIAEEGKVDGEVMREKMFDWATNVYKGRADTALKEFVENVKAGKKYPECGADDLNSHCFMKSVPVTCLYAGKPELKRKVEQAIRVHQNNDKAVAYGVASALMLERALLQGEGSDADFINTLPAEAKEAWGKASEHGDIETLFLTISHEAMKGKEDSDFYDLAGRSCALPGAFIGPCFHLKNGEDYATAVRSNILGSGDTCSRAIFFGAVIAVLKGGPPESWVAKMDKDTLRRIDNAAEKLASLAGAK